MIVKLAISVLLVQSAVAHQRTFAKLVKDVVQEPQPQRTAPKECIKTRSNKRSASVVLKDITAQLRLQIIPYIHVQLDFTALRILPPQISPHALLEHIINSRREQALEIAFLVILAHLVVQL